MRVSKVIAINKRTGTMYIAVKDNGFGTVRATTEGGGTNTVLASNIEFIRPEQKANGL